LERLGGVIFWAFLLSVLQELLLPKIGLGRWVMFAVYVLVEQC